MEKAKYWINKLNLKKHIEGGYFAETYKSDYLFENKHSSTAIYYLLQSKDISLFHRIKSDEMWHFYTGNTCIQIHVLDDFGLKTYKLGADFEKNEHFQHVIPANKWFCAELENKNSNSYVLAGCTVSPGFNYKDFEMADKEILLKKYPKYKKIISDRSS